MSKVFYCTPTYKSFDLCRKSIEAVRRGSLVPDYILVMDNSNDGEGTRYLMDLVEGDHSQVKIMTALTNLGCARSWNEFHKYVDQDYVIIANDDIEVHPYTIERLVEAAKNSPEIFFYGQSTSGDNAFSLFLLKNQGFKEIGGFDETFHPAYFEDNDFYYRLTLAGYKMVSVEGATYDHVGSSTLKRLSPTETEQHHQNFRANRDYYIRKWGGEPHHEKFKSPFDVRCFFCEKPANHRRNWRYDDGLGGMHRDYTFEPLCDEHIKEDHDVWNDYTYNG